MVVGGGIIGLAIARELKLRLPNSTVTLVEKEKDVGLHASGRNSGVIHAGFYYTADSLKARFTREGNLELKNYCDDKKITYLNCGKVVVATNDQEVSGLEELKRRGDNNRVPLEWLDEQQLRLLHPEIKTHKRALWSPSTATVDPVLVCQALKKEVLERGVRLNVQEGFHFHVDNTVTTTKNQYSVGHLINCAGLYADKVAHQFGFGMDYTLLPFKGIYLKTDPQVQQSNPTLNTNVYPVPNLDNPFLGVHFTLRPDCSMKLGPTAIPALWRENYKGIQNFSLRELLEVLQFEILLFIRNEFGFRRLAISEVKKYRRSHLRSLASKLINSIDLTRFSSWSAPGIRAQLLHKPTLRLVQDFLIEGDQGSTHILNAVSPAFTCSLPFSRHVVDNMMTGLNTRRVDSQS